MPKVRLKAEIVRLISDLSNTYEEIIRLLDAEDYVGALALFRQIREVREQVMIRLVDAARQHQNASWREVGDALGLHRSSAQQRFGPPREGHSN